MTRTEFGRIYTADQAMIRLISIAESIAPSRAAVLISGESGTGKELLARYIHEKGARANKKFIAVNCAAVPEGLLESELFGYEKGAFTGAINLKLGKFELADGGSFLLDEIGEIPLHLQAKLLRVLQEGEVERLGGKAPLKVNVRVIATTNRNLKQMVKDGTFREDLYYRLNVIPLEIPPLRNRLKDVNLLSHLFVDVSCVLNNKPAKKLSEEAIQKLMKWHWPGNVRELENVLERAVLLSQGNLIGADDIDIAGFDSITTDKSLTPGMTIFEAEQRLIINTLEFTGNNRTKAAHLLGISIRTLRNKLHEYKSLGVL